MRRPLETHNEKFMEIYLKISVLNAQLSENLETYSSIIHRGDSS